MQQRLPALRLPSASPPRWLIECGIGTLYWLVFLLVLEPDNLLRAQEAGRAPGIGHESLRMAAAALLAAAATPILLSLAARFPLSGAAPVRHALIRLTGTAGIAFGLIVVSCFLAAWAFYNDWLPTARGVYEQLAANELLMVFALSALNAIVHLCRRSRKPAREKPVALPSPYLTRVSVKSRGWQGFVELGEVDWIETQGNYLALHVGQRAHLIRETLSAFEAGLDPARFLRIHRRTLVALDRIRELHPLTNGDALLRLTDGQELRASRSYRRAIAQRWRKSPARDGWTDAKAAPDAS